MKYSKYNIKTNLSDSTPIIYNTCSRKYILQSEIDVDSESICLMRNTSKNVCIQNGIIVNIECDEQSILLSALQSEVRNGSQSITILPTTNCNARCWYCYEKGIEHFDMSQDTIDHTIQFIKDRYSTTQELSINWFGGEPLMHFDAIKQITLAIKTLGYTLNTCITTNGSLIGTDLITLLKDNYYNASMSITIDDIGNDYGKVKSFVNIPCELAYENLISNIKLVLSAGIRVLLRINYKDFENAKKIYSHLETLFSEFPKSLLYVYYAPIWNKNKGHTLDETLKFIDLMRCGHDINILANPYIDNVFLHHVANEKKISYCTAMNVNHFVINADGSIYRCHCLVSDKKYSCGNVYDGLDTSALGYTMFIPHVKDDKCDKCTLLPICLTKCKARDIIFGNDTICDNTKNIADAVIKLKIEQKEKRRCR